MYLVKVDNKYIKCSAQLASKRAAKNWIAAMRSASGMKKNKTDKELGITVKKYDPTPKEAKGKKCQTSKNTTKKK